MVLEHRLGLNYYHLQIHQYEVDDRNHTIVVPKLVTEGGGSPSVFSVTALLELYVSLVFYEFLLMTNEKNRSERKTEK